MRDLELWRLLRDPLADPDEVRALLIELAELSLDDRVPFLGLLGKPLAHADAAMRAAAVGALSGVRGRLGLQRIAHALNDTDDGVRRAAVGALRASVRDADTRRWAHALFHPDASVRRLAIDPDERFPMQELYKLYLLPDPECREMVERQVATLSINGTALPLLFDFLRQGVLPIPLARRLCRDLTWSDWQAFLAELLPRQFDMAASLEAAMQPAWPTDLFSHYHADRLDELFHLFWEPDEDEPSPHRAFFDLLWRVTIEEGVYFQQWIVFTLLGVGAQRKTWPAAVVEICAAFHAPFVACPWVPIEARHRGVAGFYRAGGRCPRRPAKIIQPLIESEFCWRGTDGKRTPDLHAMGGVLHAMEPSPLMHLIEWVGLPAIREAFRADPEASMPLFGVPDASSRGRQYLLRELSLFEGPGRFRLMALMVRAVPGDALDVLDSLDGVAACSLLGELLAQEATPGFRPFTDKKTLRLGELLAAKVAAGQVARFVQVWLDSPMPERSTLAPAQLARLIHDHDTRLILPALAALDTLRLVRFLGLIPYCAGFPYDEEVALAAKLAWHPEPSVREWAASRLREKEAFRAGRTNGVHHDEPSLRFGLCAKLDARADTISPNVAICQALLASHDPPGRVVGYLNLYLSDDSAFLTRLDVEMVKHWRGEPRLPWLGHAWLFRWDEHRAALDAALREGSADPLPFAVRSVAAAVWWAGCVHAALARRVWEAAARLLEYWRWHDRPRLEAAWSAELAEAVVEQVARSHGDVAARVAMHWQQHGAERPEVAILRERLMARMPSVPLEIRKHFHPWIDTRGLANVVPSVVVPRAVDAALSLNDLVAATLGDDLPAAIAAARALLEGDDTAHARLAEALDRRRDVRWPLGALDLLPRAAPPLREALRRLVAASAAHEVRFRVIRAVWPGTEDGLVEHCVDAACQPDATAWYGHGEHEWLLSRWMEETVELALRLLRSPHASAHGWAVDFLTKPHFFDPRTHDALLGFLDAGTGRMREWRVRAAEWLYERDERDAVVPILFPILAESETKYPLLFAGFGGEDLLTLTQGELMAGRDSRGEGQLAALLNPTQAGAARVDPFARQEALAQILAYATQSDTRRAARASLRSSLSRSRKLRRVAESFAWGVRVGRQMTGKLFTLEMIAGEELGYTRLNENKLYISPMPLLRGQQHGREVVRGLILHEYGHHLYHKGPEAEGVWKKADEEKLHRLLNLVSDEHLERNLRARDESFGNQLKLLDSFAFQHTAREVEVDVLLSILRGGAFAVLTKSHLGVARREGCVAVHSGKVLHQMEREGISFARFVRALRMGLGNRHGDEKVARGLELFQGKFRHATMPELMKVTYELRRIFGDETDLLNLFSQDLALLGDADDLSDASEDITNEELQAAIRKALEGKSPKGGGGHPGGRTYNTSPDVHFDLITNVVPMPHDPARHGVYARQVARQAEKMRRFLLQLGLGLVQQRQRITGKSFDRSRTRALVLRGDPRVLIARQIRFTTDLFLGVLIDCSGSMYSDNNIEKAKLFGTLLAEAGRGLPGVDVRLWGFTDRTIYDCGTAARPAVHDLAPTDGNNDAAALWHAAQAARASRRRAKLLVIISDGSPTQCSVAALRELVATLTRRRQMLCAQVAVRPLDDICFPHYVLLDSDQMDACVRGFGAVMVRLVRQALRG